MENMNGMKVEARNGTCQMLIITSYTYSGEIIKTNKKSIKVNLTHLTKMHGSKIVQELDMNRIETFTFFKTINDELNDGKEADVYKNKMFGIIRIAK